MAYRSYGALDDTPALAGDGGFEGVDSFNSPENLPPGMAQAAINKDFSGGDAKTRGGVLALQATATLPLALTWTARTSAADRDWFSVAYGNGIYVAVAEHGSLTDLVQTSIDGITWTSRTAASAGSWHSVAFGEGIFVAVDRSTSTGTSSFMSSPDGINWTIRTAPTTSISWNSVAYGNGRFVAVGTGANVAYSLDGINWTAGVIGSRDWNCVAYGNGYFVAVASSGTGNRAAYSTDGATWTNGASAADESWFGVVYGAGKFVAVGGSGASRVMYSTDNGATWTAASAAAANTWESVAFGGGLFVAVSLDGATRTMASRDGITWSGNAAGAANQWFGVCYGAGVFVAVANSGSGNRVMTAGQSAQVFASCTYSDPGNPGSTYTVLAGPNAATFYAQGQQKKTVNYASGLTVTTQSTIVQANNQLFIFRGPDATPLVWDGMWAGEFQLATGQIPNSRFALYVQNRLWAIVGKDSLAASNALNFTTWTTITNEFNLSTGDSNYLVTAYPFGDDGIVVFKNRSILLLSGVSGSLSDVEATDITRQVGAVGINAVVSVGPDLAYVSDRNINLLTLTSTNNSVQHKILPLSAPIQKIFNRVNWKYGHKISMGYWDNKLYVALPLDNATSCSSVVVHNFITGKWFGEWNFNEALDVQIQGWTVTSYAGLQRLHAVCEDGKIFVFTDGFYDLAGTVQAQIRDSLTTRAYRTDNSIGEGCTFHMDISTSKPTFSVTSYTSGQGNAVAAISARTYRRNETWKSGDTAYSLTNSGDNYNRAWRKDYAWTVSDNVQCRSGFLPMALQQTRVPLLTLQSGRLRYFKIDNTTGHMVINGIGIETDPGAQITGVLAG